MSSQLPQSPQAAQSPRVQLVPPLPLEVWYQILEESISLPKFLDPDNLSEVVDPLSIGAHYDVFLSDTNYWAVERHRNALQRVCKSWDTYLRRFEHRYIQMWDVYHQNVPRSALNQAIRIGFGSCHLQNCYRNHDPSHIISQAENLAVEIMSWDLLCTGLEGLFLEAKKVMPHLRVIINEATLVTHEDVILWADIINSFPKLSFMRINGLGITQWREITAASLTTLSFEGRAYPTAFPFESIDLPSLRHLRFVGPTANVAYDIDSLIPRLSIVGPKLQSLQLGGYGTHSSAVPKEIWKLCPSLQRLDTGLSLSPHHPPPLGHPLSIMSVPFPHDWGEGKGIVVPFPTALNEWPSLRRIIFFEDRRLLDNDIGPTCRSHVLELIRECKRRDVVIEEAAGLVLEEDWL